ncbi:hypothetical protein N802_18025 [Knoellia sinensis KCTC 19936]|uniref:EF-hand domain-containing protein n=1 Tax=Knoellia sinensis KCTC 19936 TaxID=1385520 RepID=A0A0A0J9G9_9MICO|nr:hypothetical protein [Knoellia sinensis]KGN32261.1 hypothetical protein N802_18025 [Knoellia sinensis KCTC 19936]
MRTDNRRTTRRVAAALATMALTGLITMTPAHAETDLNGDGTISPAEMKIWENQQGTTTPVVPAPAPGTGSLVPTDDNAIEYLQVALGVVGGMVVVGSVIAATSARHRHQAHPA